MIIETERLLLRRFTLDDAAFVITLLNEPSFIKNIADKGVRSEADAWAYLRDGPLASYDRHGFGLYCVVEKTSMSSIGMCGLLKRDQLDDADLGYAFLPEYWSKGYALESARAVIKYAHDDLRLSRLLAICNVDNQASIRLLEKCHFQFDKIVELYDDGVPTKLFTCAWS